MECHAAYYTPSIRGWISSQINQSSEHAKNAATPSCRKRIRPHRMEAIVKANPNTRPLGRQAYIMAALQLE